MTSRTKRKIYLAEIVTMSLNLNRLAMITIQFTLSDIRAPDINFSRPLKTKPILQFNHKFALPLTISKHY